MPFNFIRELLIGFLDPSCVINHILKKTHRITNISPMPKGLSFIGSNCLVLCLCPLWRPPDLVLLWFFQKSEVYQRTQSAWALESGTFSKRNHWGTVERSPLPVGLSNFLESWCFIVYLAPKAPSGFKLLAINTMLNEALTKPQHKQVFESGFNYMPRSIFSSIWPYYFRKLWYLPFVHSRNPASAPATWGLYWHSWYQLVISGQGCFPFPAF